MSQPVGILLAAGCSQRFGADKRWHPMADGTPMVLASARHLAGICTQTVVVIRPGDDDLAVLLNRADLRHIVCHQAHLGMGHSLAAAITATPNRWGWLVALADMPFIESGSYQVVLSALAQGALIARPVIEGQVGHPVGFAAQLQHELVNLQGDRGGAAIIERHRAALHLCPVNDSGILKDIDLMTDLEN
ncbi:nucleotidyltransferase family protein [Ampullimonas aquatilis]|uniref:nucleotidyltransferase family protein n=1 Tax=Ampullimonas aquatilis TaxID=1341549 RepID=UPI003C74578B